MNQSEVLAETAVDDAVMNIFIYAGIHFTTSIYRISHHRIIYVTRGLYVKKFSKLTGPIYIIYNPSYT